MTQFTDETKRLKICEILGLNTIQLGIKITTYAEHLTAAVEARVDLQIERWESGIGEDFDAIDGNLKNFGLNTNPEAERNDIRNKIAKALFFTASELAELTESAYSSDSFTMERG